jgi:hypothetical protein
MNPQGYFVTPNDVALAGTSALGDIKVPHPGDPTKTVALLNWKK